MHLRAAVSIQLEREVVVVSNDGDVRREVSAVVDGHPGAWTLLDEAEGLAGKADRRGACIVVIDDAAQEGALELVHRWKAGPREAAVVYLAADHSAALESAVRQAGASFYCVKAGRDGHLTRVIEALLGKRER